MMTIQIRSKRPIDQNTPAYITMRQALTRLKAKDFTLWGKAAEAETSIRLDWIDLPNRSKELLPELDKVEDFLAKNRLSHLILCGMGGSSLGPEVLAKTFSKQLVCIDTTDPDQLLHNTPEDLTHTAVIVGSKSGGTAETSSQKEYFVSKLESQGLDPKNHLIIVTDPGSPFDKDCRAKNYFVINANPNIGGRFSVLSAFGLVPAAAMVIDVAALLDEAEKAEATFTTDDSPALHLAAAILQYGNQILSMSDAGTSVPGIADWIEQLIAESTGKEGVGFLPIAIPTSHSPAGADGLKIGFSIGGDEDIVVEASLGEHFILWEWATALLGIPMQINIFDQPNVQEAKTSALALLDKWKAEVPSITSDAQFGSVQVFGAIGDSLRDILLSFFKETQRYSAVMAYLARGVDDSILSVQNQISIINAKPTSFGWGPRFLHSTGQFHKGGQPNGSFLVITGENRSDVAIPGKDYSFHTLLMAQGIGDYNALKAKNLHAIRLHLTDRAKGIAELLQALN